MQPLDLLLVLQDLIMQRCALKFQLLPIQTICLVIHPQHLLTSLLIFMFLPNSRKLLIFQNRKLLLKHLNLPNRLLSMSLDNEDLLLFLLSNQL